MTYESAIIEATDDLYVALLREYSDSQPRDDHGRWTSSGVAKINLMQHGYRPSRGNPMKFEHEEGAEVHLNKNGSGTITTAGERTAANEFTGWNEKPFANATQMTAELKAAHPEGARLQRLAALMKRGAPDSQIRGEVKSLGAHAAAARYASYKGTDTSHEWYHATNAHEQAKYMYRKMGRSSVKESIESPLADPVALREEWVTIDGRHIDIGAGGGEGVMKSAGTPLTKSEIAKASKNVAKKYAQDIANDSEKELSAHLGMDRTPDNKPFDLQSKTTGIEIKTAVTQKNDKITMSKSAIAKKDAASESLKKTFTVVVDKRPPECRPYDKINNPGGPRDGVLTAPKYYVRDGYGSFRLGTMQEVTIDQLRSYIRTSSGKLAL